MKLAIFFIQAALITQCYADGNKSPEYFANRLITEAAKRKITMNLSGLRFDYFADNNSPYAGLCDPKNNVIHLNRGLWNTMVDDARELLVSHEMGHCVLGRVHRHLPSIANGGVLFSTKADEACWLSKIKLADVLFVSSDESIVGVCHNGALSPDAGNQFPSIMSPRMINVDVFRKNRKAMYDELLDPFLSNRLVIVEKRYLELLIKEKDRRNEGDSFFEKARALEMYDSRDGLWGEY